MGINADYHSIYTDSVEGIDAQLANPDELIHRHKAMQ